MNYLSSSLSPLSSPYLSHALLYGDDMEMAEVASVLVNSGGGVGLGGM